MKQYRKWIAGLLAVMISAGATGSLAYAQNKTQPAQENASVSEPDAADQTSAPARKAASGRACKDETVYVLCNADASVKKVIVSDWLKNTPALGALADVSGLSGIVNVKGAEPFTQQNNQLSWDAEGDDIYYQGSTDREPPVTVHMTYYLDGKQIAPEQLAGKSGHLRIRWDYENHAKAEVRTEHGTQNVTVPFLAASAAVLDSENCLNAQVTNGRLISDGNRLIAVGAAFPGLNDSLGLGEIAGMELQLPEYFELTADVRDFQMNSSVTVVSDELFSKLDTDGMFSDEKLTEQIQQLCDGAGALCDGTAALYDGIEKLSDGSGDLTDGIEKLVSGSAALKDGAVSLENGAAQLKDGAGTLSGGAKQLTDGIRQAKDGSGALTAGCTQVQQGAAALTDGIKQAKDGADALQAGLADAKAGAGQLDSGFAAVASGAETLSSGAEKFKAGAGQLETGSGQLSSGAAALADNVKKMHGGAENIKESSEKLSDGIGSAKTGADALNSGIAQAAEGADTLQNGADALASGAEQLRSEEHTSELQSPQ